MTCKELTPQELKITNGCGSSFIFARPFRIPKWISRQFWRCCNRHDIRYQRGVDPVEKAMADDELLDCMYYSAFHGPWWNRWILLTVADLTYWCLGTWLSDWCFHVAGKGKIV